MSQKPNNADQKLNLQLRSNLVFDIPQQQENTFNFTIMQLKYKNTKQYYLKALKDFTPKQHFCLNKDSDIVLKSEFSNKFIWLFIVFFCYNSHKPENSQILLIFKKFTYTRSLSIPQNFNTEDKFWLNGQQQLAIRTIIAKVSDQINGNTFNQWINFFANHQVILLLYQLIMRNILKQIKMTDKYLKNTTQITQQQINLLSKYLGLALDNSNQVYTQNCIISKYSLIFKGKQARISANDSSLEELKDNSKKTKKNIQYIDENEKLQCCCKFW